METKWTEIEIEQLKVDVINLRCRQRRSIDEIAKSIHEFGFLQPVVVDENYTVIIGEGRLKAAKRMQLKTVPVVIVKGLTEDQRQRLQIADNRLTELSRWNKIELLEMLEQLCTIQTTEIPGFSREEVSDLLGLTEVSQAKSEFPPEIETTANHCELHFLVSCRTSCLNKMAGLIKMLKKEPWCTLEQTSR